MSNQTCESALSDNVLNALMDKILSTTTTGILAISGGPDSMALLGIFNAFLPTQNKQDWIVACVNHGLRDEAGKEADYVVETAKGFGFDAYHLKTKKIYPVNAQNARTARYEALKNLCETQGIGYVLTAHHQDDQFETMMMRFLKGSGIEGLSAMPKCQEMKSYTILRPLLGFSKLSLVHTCNALKISYFEDSSNHDIRYERSKIRALFSDIHNHKLSYQNLALGQQRYRDDADFINHYTNRFIDQHVSYKIDWLQVRLEKLFEEHNAITKRVLKILVRYFSNKHHIQETKIDKILMSLNELKALGDISNVKNKKIAQLHQVEIYCHKGILFVFPDKNEFHSKTSFLDLGDRLNLSHNLTISLLNQSINSPDLLYALSFVKAHIFYGKGFGIKMLENKLKLQNKDSQNMVLPELNALTHQKLSVIPAMLREKITIIKLLEKSGEERYIMPAFMKYIPDHGDNDINEVVQKACKLGKLKNNMKFQCLNFEIIISSGWNCQHVLR